MATGAGAWHSGPDVRSRSVVLRRPGASPRQRWTHTVGAPAVGRLRSGSRPRSRARDRGSAARDRRRDRQAHRRAGVGDRSPADRAVRARPLPVRRRARPGQDAADPDAVRRARPVVRAHPVHARPDAVGHHRHRRAGRGPRHRAPRLPLRARAGLRQRDPRRRDQPHAAQDPGGAAAVDAGVPRVGGRPDLRPAAAVSGLRDAEPDRAGGHLPAARGAARPLHVPDRRRAIRRRTKRSASSTR